MNSFLLGFVWKGKVPMETKNYGKRAVDFLIEECLAEVSAGVARDGPVQCDVAEMNALKDAIRLRVHSHAVSPFSPDMIASDRELVNAMTDAKVRLGRLRGKRDVLETRLLSTCEQTAQMPAPRKSVAGMIAGAVGVFTLCFSPTIAGVFFSGVDDHVLAWAVSAVIGAAVGGFLTLMLLNFEEEE
jgi:hypothetical protein